MKISTIGLFCWMVAFAAAAVEATQNVPSFTVPELLAPSPRDSLLLSTLTTTGLLSISLDDNDNDLSLLQGLCDCQDFSTIDGTDTALFDTVIRSTLASATVGSTTPLPLPDSLGTACGASLQDNLEEVRDVVAAASHAFVVALDRLLLLSSSSSTSSSSYLMRDASSSKVYPTVSSIEDSANHLEHFHIYEKAQDEATTSNKSSNKSTLDWHVDAGLFLAFVPGQDCSSSTANDDASFYFRNAHQQEVPAVFSPNSVAIMLGVGAQHWLQTSIQLKATQHAVQMTPGTKRVWYGMMHLVPETAIVQESPTPKTFGDMRANMLLAGAQPRTFGDIGQDEDDEGDDFVSIGCGPASLSDDHPEVMSLSTSRTTTTRRRRLQHVPDATHCNNATNFFCWMTCLDIPNAHQRDEYVKEGYSLYCLDPGILAASGNVVSTAMEPCLDRFSPNSNCLGSWQKTAPGVEPSAIVELSSDSTIPTTDTFCYGGTSMYMDGFHWVHSTTCVIYLFPQWVLTSQGKLAAAAIGTILFGILLELTIMQRRASMAHLAAGPKRLAATALFYGLQLTMGYFLMLVVMTYSGVLFFCTIVGVVTGHVLFNAKDALLFRNNKNKKTTTKSDSSSTQEEPEQAPFTPGDVVEGDCCLAGTRKTTSDDDGNNEGVPEGSTPCCQHVL